MRRPISYLTAWCGMSYSIDSYQSHSHSYEFASLSNVAVLEYDVANCGSHQQLVFRRFPAAFRFAVTPLSFAAQYNRATV